jgi:CubicO group peptidase (beta-lactamase class C family)
MSRRAFAQLTGAAAFGLALAPAFAFAPATASARSARRRSGGDLGERALIDGNPADVGMDAALLDDAFARVARRAADGRFPGAVALVARQGVVVGQRAFGVRVAGSAEAMTTDTIFDVESMTKVLATTTMAMRLVKAGRLSLLDRVAKYLPEFAANAKGSVLVRDLLRYSSGLPVDNQKVDTNDLAAIWAFMLDTPLEYAIGSSVEYSDLGFRILGKVLETIAGETLDSYCKREVWGQLGMTDTTYNPAPSLVSRTAATGGGSLGLRAGPLRGSVQDDQDWKLGGIVGCDGVFTTARDVAVFSQMVLNGGEYNTKRVLDSKLVDAMVANQTPQVTEAATDLDPTSNLLSTPKGYGFELWTHRFSPGGMRLSPGSYGKTGGAGTYMWIDPAKSLVMVLLTNHGLPVPFDQPGWNRLSDDIAMGEFCDGVVQSIVA